MCELIISFGKYKNHCVCILEIIDPGYIAEFMWGFANKYNSKLYKTMLELGYDRISPTIQFKGRHHKHHISNVRDSDPNYYKWLYYNQPLRHSHKAIDRWMKANPNGTIACRQKYWLA